MKNWILALIALILMVAIDPITDGIMVMSDYWQPIACIAAVGAVWLVWCYRVSGGEWE